jgi:coenzyme F420-0:L-glutamate ligase/coenzyme F420-1:gamma-L-glutamate ligase
VALATSSITLTAIPGIPHLCKGDDLAGILADALMASDLEPESGDILVITHKIISKAEGRYVSLKDVRPSPQAIDLAAKTGKDPALVEVVLSESRRVLRF